MKLIKLNFIAKCIVIASLDAVGVPLAKGVAIQIKWITSLTLVMTVNSFVIANEMKQSRE